MSPKRKRPHADLVDAAGPLAQEIEKLQAGAEMEDSAQAVQLPFHSNKSGSRATEKENPKKP